MLNVYVNTHENIVQLNNTVEIDMRKIVMGFFCLVNVFVLAAGTGNGECKNTTAASFPKGSLGTNARIILLHHSTGMNVWKGGLASWIASYNSGKGTNYSITELSFPSSSYPGGWKNYPYDYWNIWINHGGASYYGSEPTLTTLIKQYNVIIFKHCFPVSDVTADSGVAAVSSEGKQLQNYKLQYGELKKLMHSYPGTRFIVWTGAALTARSTNEANAKRAKAFSDWVKNTWDEKGDNIYVWDFRTLETGGGLYMKDENAASPNDSHPGVALSRSAAPKLGRRIVDVIDGKGDTGSLTGE